MVGLPRLSRISRARRWRMAEGVIRVLVRAAVTLAPGGPAGAFPGHGDGGGRGIQGDGKRGLRRFETGAAAGGFATAGRTGCGPAAGSVAGPEPPVGRGGVRAVRWGGRT